MGKRLLQQRRGKASPSYRAPSHRYAGRPSFRQLDGREIVAGKVLDLIHSVGHNVPLAVVAYETGERVLIPANEGLLVGQMVHCGAKAEVKEGNILPLSAIPEGTAIFDIELRPGDGGKLIHSSGSYGYLASKEGKLVTVRLPSGLFRTFNPACRAIIGVVAGAGRTELPIAKAGKAHYMHHARNIQWPTTSAGSKNPVDHPFGGGGHQHIGKSQTVSHNAPPGRKVGSIAARRMGRKKK